jgi:DNA-binding response OmpR family regulator
MKILIADDDPTSRFLLETLLTKSGHEVISTPDGTEALRALQSPGAPLVAVLDWLMPGMDGPDICRQMRASGSTVYIILITAQGKGHITEGLRAGADDYLSKPLDEEELLARLEVGERVIRLQSALATRVKELEEALATIDQWQAG